MPLAAGARLGPYEIVAPVGAGGMGTVYRARDVLGIARNATGTGAEWELWAVEVASGRERRMAALDLPGATDDLRGFSLHPDGTRFATSIALWPYDIWMLEGFEP